MCEHLSLQMRPHSAVAGRKNRVTLDYKWDVRDIMATRKQRIETAPTDPNRAPGTL